MADISSLLNRIDAQFAAQDERLKKLQAEAIEEHHARQARLEKYSQQIEALAEVWRPRLDALAQKFGDRVKVTPRIDASSRDATFQFQSNVAKISLKFSAYAADDVRKIVCAYDLHILPVLMQFEKHDEIAFPLDAVDKEVLGRWMDDRIVNFVQTYLALHENEYYLKDQMVEDPVARVRLPKYAAAAQLEHQRQTYYFISEETRAAFAKERGL
jgi:YHS domain-containing protein